MNVAAPSTQSRRSEVERLQALFAAMEKTEPALLAKITDTMGVRLSLLVPRLRAYAIETGEMKASVDFRVTVDFTPGSEGFVLEANITPPSYSHSEIVPLRHAREKRPA